MSYTLELFSAAVEAAAIYKVPSMAVSTEQFDYVEQFSTAADYTAILFEASYREDGLKMIFVY